MCYKYFEVKHRVILTHNPKCGVHISNHSAEKISDEKISFERLRNHRMMEGQGKSSIRTANTKAARGCYC